MFIHSANLYPAPNVYQPVGSGDIAGGQTGQIPVHTAFSLLGVGGRGRGKRYITGKLRNFIMLMHSTLLSLTGRPDQASVGTWRPPLRCEGAVSWSNSWKIVWHFLLMLHIPRNSTPGYMSNRNECLCPPKTYRKAQTRVSEQLYSSSPNTGSNPDVPHRSTNPLF